MTNSQSHRHTFAKVYTFAYLLLPTGERSGLRHRIALPTSCTQCGKRLSAPTAKEARIKELASKV